MEGWEMIRRGTETDVTFAARGSSPDQGFTPDDGIAPEATFPDVNIWDGKWHHIAVAWNNLTYIYYYVYGVRAEKWFARSFDSPSTLGQTDYDIFIGASSGEIQGGGIYSNSDAHFWKGRIDDVHIYDRYLSQTEINEIIGRGQLEPWRFPCDLYFEGEMGTCNFKDYQILANQWLADETFPLMQ